MKNQKCLRKNSEIWASCQFLRARFFRKFTLFFLSKLALIRRRSLLFYLASVASLPGHSCLTCASLPRTISRLAQTFFFFFALLFTCFSNSALCSPTKVTPPLLVSCGKCAVLLNPTCLFVRSFFFVAL